LKTNHLATLCPLRHAARANGNKKWFFTFGCEMQNFNFRFFGFSQDLFRLVFRLISTFGWFFAGFIGGRQLKFRINYPAGDKKKMDRT
jgi:hypothetical protein